MMTPWHENLLRLVPIVAAKIEECRVDTGEFSHADYSGWRKRHDAADAKMLAFFRETEEAKFSTRGAHEHTVRMAGIRSSSTGGWTSTLQNWKRAAERQIEIERTPDPEENCPGHVSAPGGDPKVCMRCGVHVDSLRGDYDDPINLQASGPAPILPRDAP